MSKAEQMYGIFLKVHQRDGWPPWEQLGESSRRAFEDMAAGAEGAPEKLEPGKYKARAAGWVFDTTNKGSELLRVRFHVPLANNRVTQVDWAAWLSEKSLLGEEGKPGPTLRGLLALGATQEDIQGLISSGEITGLNRNEVEIEVVKNDRGYLEVQWVNAGARELQAQAPLGRAEKAKVGQRMLAALTRLGKGGGAPAAGGLPTQAQRPGDASDEAPPF